MTPVEIVGAVVAVVSSGAIGGVVAKAVEWRKAGGEVAKSERADAKDQNAALVTGLERLVGTLQGIVDTGLAREAVKITAHAECLELVGEMGGRIEDQELRLNRAEAALEDCQKQHARAAADAQALREQVRQLDRRTPSESAMPAVKESAP